MEGVFCCRPSPGGYDSAPTPKTGAFRDELTQLPNEFGGAPPDILVPQVECVRNPSRPLEEGRLGGCHGLKRWDMKPRLNVAG